MDTPGNRPESAQDHYATLGVSRDASPDEIKKGYRTLITKYHPDRNHGPDAEWKTKEINEAYSILSDPEKKSNYDHPRPPSYMHDHDDHVRGKGYHSSQDGSYTYKTYTWTYGDNKKAENTENPAMAQILLRIVFKVVVLLIALWLILHFFVLFIIIVFIVMLIYLASQVMGQIIGFFFNRR